MDEDEPTAGAGGDQGMDGAGDGSMDGSVEPVAVDDSTGAVDGGMGDAGMGDGGVAEAPPSGPAWDQHSLGEEDYAPSDSSGSSGLESLSLEVTLLSIDAVDRVVNEVARRIEPVAREHKLRGVVIADPGSIAMLRTHAALTGELAALDAQVTRIEAVPPADGGDGLEGGFVGLGSVYDAARGVRALANNVGKALKVFEVVSTYQGTQVAIAPSVLHAALAKHLTARGLEAQVPRYSVGRQSGSGFVDRLLGLQRRCQVLEEAGTANADVGAIKARIDQLVLSLFTTSNGGDGTGGVVNSVMQQIAEADMLAAAIADGYGLLTAELTASGGNYRMRKWILNALFGRDGLTYSGGAAVTYFLLSGKRMAALTSDTVYFTSGHGSFGNRYHKFSPTNIAGLETY